MRMKILNMHGISLRRGKRKELLNLERAMNSMKFMILMNSKKT
jgi:hypothetical protein